MIAVDRDEPRLRRAVQAIQAAGGRAHARPVDVLDPSGVAEVVRTVLEELGRIDTLINGVGGSTVIARPDAEVGDLTLDQWRQLLAFNLELLRALEAAPRWIYSGACGWVSGQDAARFSLAIRGVFRHGHRSFLHVGAGIMAESSPEGELQETCHKLAAMKDALSCSSWSAHQHGRIAHEE